MKQTKFGIKAEAAFRPWSSFKPSGLHPCGQRVLNVSPELCCRHLEQRPRHRQRQRWSKQQVSSSEFSAASESLTSRIERALLLSTFTNRKDSANHLLGGGGLKQELSHASRLEGIAAALAILELQACRNLLRVGHLAMLDELRLRTHFDNSFRQL